jgi:hypothetical protein
MQMVIERFQVNDPIGNRRGVVTGIFYSPLELSIKMFRKAVTAGFVRRLSGQTTVILCRSMAKFESTGTSLARFTALSV